MCAAQSAAVSKLPFHAKFHAAGFAFLLPTLLPSSLAHMVMRETARSRNRYRTMRDDTETISLLHATERHKPSPSCCDFPAAFRASAVQVCIDRYDAKFMTGKKCAAVPTIQQATGVAADYAEKLLKESDGDIKGALTTYYLKQWPMEMIMPSTSSSSDVDATISLEGPSVRGAIGNMLNPNRCNELAESAQMLDKALPVLNSLTLLHALFEVPLTSTEEDQLYMHIEQLDKCDTTPEGRRALNLVAVAAAAHAKLAAGDHCPRTQPVPMPRHTDPQHSLDTLAQSSILCAGDAMCTLLSHVELKPPSSGRASPASVTALNAQLDKGVAMLSPMYTATTLDELNEGLMHRSIVAMLDKLHPNHTLMSVRLIPSPAGRAPCLEFKFAGDPKKYVCSRGLELSSTRLLSFQHVCSRLVPRAAGAS